MTSKGVPQMKEKGPLFDLECFSFAACHVLLSTVLPSFSG